MVLLMENLNDSPVSAKEIAAKTKRDPVMSKVYRFTHNGWPNRCAEELKPYELRKNELSVQDWGNSCGATTSTECYPDGVTRRASWSQSDDGPGPMFCLVARY